MTSAKRGAHRLTRVCTDAHTRGFTGVRADAHARMRAGSLGSAQGRAVRDHRSLKLIDTGLRRGGRGFTVRGVSCEDAGVGAAGGGLAGPHALCV